MHCNEQLLLEKYFVESFLQTFDLLFTHSSCYISAEYLRVSSPLIPSPKPLSTVHDFIIAWASYRKIRGSMKIGYFIADVRYADFEFLRIHIFGCTHSGSVCYGYFTFYVVGSNPIFSYEESHSR